MSRMEVDNRFDEEHPFRVFSVYHGLDAHALPDEVRIDGLGWSLWLSMDETAFLARHLNIVIDEAEILARGTRDVRVVKL